MNHLTHLECSRTGAVYDANRLQTLSDVGHPLLARYDLESVGRALTPRALLERPPTMWRYRELLPVADWSQLVTLGESMTPVLPVPRLGRALGLEDLWVKDETRLPTGTFKARGLAMAVTRARELGARTLAIPSAGNAAEAAAVYAARAGLECVVAMPSDAPVANVLVCEAAGAKVTLVDGLIDEAGRWVRAGAEANGWFDLSTFREPYRVEGKKTMGLELAEQLDWRLPDVIVYPTGGGTGLVGMHKAFDELQALGWVAPERPRWVAVQAEGCAPVVRAFARGADDVEPWEAADTIAGGLRVPSPLAGRLILGALRDTGGVAVAVSDHDILAAIRLALRTEGLQPSPESAATIVAARQLAEAGTIARSERVVLFQCGTLLKHTQLLA